MMVTITKTTKKLITLVEIFKNMDVNIPGGNFLGGNFLVGNFPDTVKLCDVERTTYWKILLQNNIKDFQYAVNEMKFNVYLK